MRTCLEMEAGSASPRVSLRSHWRMGCMAIQSPNAYLSCMDITLVPDSRRAEPLSGHVARCGSQGIHAAIFGW